MRNDEQLKLDVEEALKWEPLLSLAEIEVVAREGIVSLAGTVDSYSKKLGVLDAVKKVAGVTAVVENIQVEFRIGDRKDDSSVSIDVVDALKKRWEVPYEKITVNVENGRVVLTGETKWNYERVAAEKAIHNLSGVRVVVNNLRLRTNIQDTVRKADVERALARNWAIRRQHIDVEVRLNKVTLTGKVSSLYQKEEAERLAWAAPGVSAMENEVVVHFDD
jgi:osmotically-inducible protein OsmY